MFWKFYDQERESERIKRLLSRLPAKITLLTEEVRASQIEEQKRAKQFCDEERGEV